MSIEVRLKEMQESRVARVVQARMAEEEDRRQKYTRALIELADFGAKIPILADLGIDCKAWRKAGEDYAGPVPNVVAIHGNAEVDGYKIHTALQWGATISPSHVDGCHFKVAWEGDEKAHVSDYVTTLSRFEEQALEAIEKLMEKIRQTSHRETKDGILHKLRIEAAQHFIQAAKEYSAELVKYEAERDNWLKTEQERLWKPWKVYEIQILPYAAATKPVEPTSITVLESPRDIIGALSTSLSMSTEVTRVLPRGDLETYTICGIYYSKHIEMDKPGWEFHRRYRSDDYDFGDDIPAIYVPANVKESPVAPPEWIGSWRDVCDIIHNDKVKDTWEGQAFADVYHKAFRLGPNAVSLIEDPEQLVNS